MKYYTEGGQSQKSYGHICNKKLDVVIEFINNNKDNYDIKTMCTVLGVSRSTYYKSFDKSKSAREVENEELKAAIMRIYKAEKVYMELLEFIIYWIQKPLMYL